MSSLASLAARAGSTAELCRLVGEHLGLGVPMPAAAAERAVADASFAAELVRIRDDRAALERALTDPSNALFAPPPRAELPARDPAGSGEPTNAGMARS